MIIVFLIVVCRNGVPNYACR